MKVPGRSHLTRGAWIEIIAEGNGAISTGSHLTRGAWIEIFCRCVTYLLLWSHLTRGAWIEIAILLWLAKSEQCRTSHEVRGLKWMESIYGNYIYVAPHTRCVD